MFSTEYTALATACPAMIPAVGNVPNCCFKILMI